MTGFSIQSPAAPGTSTGYVQGWAPLPEADDPEDIAAAGYDLTLFDSSKNSVQVPAQAPKPQCNDGVDNDNDGLIDMADPAVVRSHPTAARALTAPLRSGHTHAVPGRWSAAVSDPNPEAAA